MLLASVLVSGGDMQPASAGGNAPLYLNLTSDDGRCGAMAIGFGAKQLVRGVSLSMFLSDKGVLLASQANTGRFAEQQKAITDRLATGGSVIVCTICMKHFGMKEADRTPCVKLGCPDLLAAALLKDSAKSLTW